ncbi:MAG: methyltransferase domain-containing protein [Deltaproteobacteria bacterium]
MTRKEIIKRSFSRAAETYDSYAVVQKEAARLLSEGVCDVLSAMPQSAAQATPGPGGKQNQPQAQNAGRFLDLGSGTGDLLVQFDKRLEFSLACGVDLALPMLKMSRGKNRAACVQADIDSLPFVDASFDIIASSLAFQWAGDLKGALAEAKRVLAKGPRAILAVSTLGAKTLGELRASIGAFKSEVPVNFIGIDELILIFREAGLTVLKAEARAVVKTYQDLNALLITLKKTGVQPSVNAECLGLGVRGRLKEAHELYRKKHITVDGAIPATYEIVTIIAINAG